MGAQKVEAASKLARFFGETNTQIKRFEAIQNGLPSNWQALMTVGRRLAPQYGPLLDQFPEARARTPLWITYYANTLDPAMQQVVMGNKTAEQALNDVQAKVEHLFTDIFY